MPNNERKGKWQPFDGLDGFKRHINNVEQERNRQQKPVLMPDELELLNEKLCNALCSQNEVEVVYFQAGYFCKTRGEITKVDAVFKEIMVGEKKVKISAITQIID
ncbi:MAG: YolD-like family protein [Bacilli bacterium]